MRKIKNFFILTFLLIAFSSLAYAESPIKIETLLTDIPTDNPSISKDVFSRQTQSIYLFWSSNQLKKAKTLRSVWIAEDTDAVPRSNYKIDEFTVELSKDAQGNKLAPKSNWHGKFTVQKPNHDWPLGRYRIDIFVDGDYVKSIKFHIDSIVSEPSA